MTVKMKWKGRTKLRNFTHAKIHSGNEDSDRPPADVLRDPSVPTELS